MQENNVWIKRAPDDGYHPLFVCAARNVNVFTEIIMCAFFCQILQNYKKRKIISKKGENAFLPCEFVMVDVLKAKTVLLAAICN